MNPFLQAPTKTKGTPFAATAPGIALNTVLGLPKATVKVAKDIGQGIARSAASAGLTLAKPLGGVDTLSSSDINSDFGQELFKRFFGTEPVKAIEDRIAEAELSIKRSPFAQRVGLDKVALPLAFGGVMGITALDLTPFGSLEKNATKALLKETSELGAKKLLLSMKVPEEIATKFAPHFAEANTQEAVQDVFNNLRGVVGVKRTAEVNAAKGVVESDPAATLANVEGKLVVEPAPKADTPFKLSPDEIRRGDEVARSDKRSEITDPEELLRFIDREGSGNVGVFLKSGEKKLLGDYLATIDTPENTGLRGAIVGSERPAANGSNDLVLGKINDFFVVVADNGFGAGKVRIHRTPFAISRDKVLGRVDSQVYLGQPSSSTAKEQTEWAKAGFKTQAEMNAAFKDIAANSESDISNIPQQILAGKITFKPETKPSEWKDILGSRYYKVFKKDAAFTVDAKASELGFESGEELKNAVADLVFNRFNTKPPEAPRAPKLGKLLDETTTAKGAEHAPVQKDIQPLEATEGEVRSIEAQAEQALSKIDESVRGQIPSLPKIVAQAATNVRDKVNLLDYMRTPDRVLTKIGFGAEARELRKHYEEYLKELPKNIEKITEWSKRVPKASNERIFKYLDGQAITLNDNERVVATEIRLWLQGWAKRLKLPEDNTITNYITHIFDKELLSKEFDEDLAKIITDKLPGSVYDPFLLKRLGAKGYRQNTWEALDAYVKRGTRKANLDPVLEQIKDKAGTSLDLSNIEASQFKYIHRYISHINLRPTELDNLIDAGVKTIVGYKFGQRPVTYLTQLLRRMTYRGMLGLNPGSALRNLSQGINTYAVLGSKYTTVGYAKLFNRGSWKELEEQGVLQHGFIQDRALSSTKKAIEALDKGLFVFFEGAERLNRGSAYFGAKSKAINGGATEEEAIEFAKEIVRKTQFAFGSVDTPVALQSDIAKTLMQFQNFTLKQTEFLAEMAKDKNFVGLLRYAVAGTLFVYTVGRAFGMEPKELIPGFRLGTPPSLKLPVEVAKAVLDSPDKYGRDRDLGDKAQDIFKSGIGLFPAGTQLKKSIEGVNAAKQGESTDAAGRHQFDVGGTAMENLQALLFGKYAGQDAKDYFDKSPAKKKETTNPFLR